MSWEKHLMTHLFEQGSKEEIRSKVLKGIRLARSEAEQLFKYGDDAFLMELASEVRRRFHEPHRATYLMMAIVNYTNVCVAKCDYCAFYRLPHQSGTYLLNFDQICEKIDALIQHGGDLVAFNGGFHPKLRIKDYAELFRGLHNRYGETLNFFEMTVAEFMFACKVSKVSYSEGAELLKSVGTQWVTGGGAEVLDETFRKRHSPGKFSVEDYFKAQRTIIESGIGSTATMVIGFDESLEERMNHLDALRSFQDSLPVRMPSFLCWTYKPHHTELGGQELSTQEYLRWMAVCRIYLDNFENIRTSVLTKNEGALKALRYGANDFDLPTEDEVTQKAGATISSEFEGVLQSARLEGFEPVLRPMFRMVANPVTLRLSSKQLEPHHTHV